jgi:hypothetical protein
MHVVSPPWTKRKIAGREMLIEIGDESPHFDAVRRGQ